MAAWFRCGVVCVLFYILSDPARLKWFASDRPVPSPVFTAAPDVP